MITADLTSGQEALKRAKVVQSKGKVIPLQARCGPEGG